MDALTRHLSSWGDTNSINKLKGSHKGKEVIQAEIVNALVSLAQRFTVAPGREKFQYWAQDLVCDGYTDDHVKTVCPLISKQFEKFPSLRDVYALLRSNCRPSTSILEYRDPVAEKERKEVSEIRAKWIEILGEDLLPRMCKSYAKNVLGHSIESWEYWGLSGSWIEHLVLLDWKRAGFGDATAILRQGQVSQERFRRPLKEVVEGKSQVPQ